ncbi:MAG TPA: hypothetical protein VMU14_13375 [Acidimicrobiales bacterium]|nr:hypothetical protein [Acidimicrobiales bacterium]
MVITVAVGAAPEVELVEPDDFTRFHVAARGAPDRSRLGAALTAAGAGELDGDDVLVAVAWLRAAAVGRVAAEWDEGFTAMLDYAERKGWTDASRRTVRAHVEWGQ